jgi:hypothetical protein
MVRNSRREFAIPIFEREFTILETVSSIGPCTTAQVQEKLNDGTDLLQVMRKMHALVDRGLLERITIDRQSFYKVKSNYKTMVRTYLKEVIS